MTLTAGQAEEIRRLDRGAVRARQIGEMVGVSIRTVNEVLDGRRQGRPLSPREQADLDAQQGWRAACMDDLEWAEWIARNPLHISESSAAARPCTDCPLGFAADMRAHGRCNGTPGGVAADPDEPEEEETMDPATAVRTEPDRGVRVAVVLEAPCGRCEKADVCSLRPDVEALTQLPVLVPVLDRRVGLELAGSVTCSAFVKARIRKADAGELDAKRKPSRPRAVAAPSSDPRVVVPGTTLTPRQAEVLDAFVRHGGNRQATAAELGLVYQSVDGMLEAIAIKGLLPDEVLDAVPARIRRLQLQDQAVPAGSRASRPSSPRIQP